MADSRYINLVGSLERDLTQQARVVDRYESYFFGDNMPAFSSEEWKRIFGAQLEALHVNWCQLVVDAAAERLAVTGFTFPSLAKAEAPAGADPVAQEIWESNSLGSLQGRAHTTAVYAGRAYVSVEPPADGEEISRVSIEHPAQTYVRMSPAREGDRLAAIKVWWEYDDDGSTADQLLTLYLPDRTYELRRKRVTLGPGGGVTLGDPVPRSGDELRDEVPNGLGVVPVVPLENRPLLLAAGPRSVGTKLLLGGMSDLMPVTPIQDAIDKSWADWMVNGESIALPVRYGVGIDPPIDPVTKKPLDREEWKVTRDKFLLAKSKDAKFGQLPADDGTGLRERVEALVNNMAALTRTPPHYLLGAMINTSGDALKAAEAGLVKRIKAKQAPLSNGWEQATRIACGFQGDERRFRDKQCAASWDPIEVTSKGESMDAAIKAFQAKLLPGTMVLEELGMNAQQIERAGKLLGWPDREDPANPKPPTSPPPPPDGGSVPAQQGQGEPPPAPLQAA